MDEQNGKYVYNSKSVIKSGVDTGKIKLTFNIIIITNIFFCNYQGTLIGLILGGLLTGFLLSIFGTIGYYILRKKRNEANETMLYMSNPIS